MTELVAENIVAILQLGFSGVAFLFLYMSYSLLNKEQGRDHPPRDKILQSIRSFSTLSVIIAVLVIVASVVDFYLKEKTLPEKCSNAVERAALLLQNPDGHNEMTLRSLLENTLTDCQ